MLYGKYKINWKNVFFDLVFKGLIIMYILVFFMKRIWEYKNNKDKNKSEKNNKIWVLYVVKVDFFFFGSYYYDNG